MMKAPKTYTVTPEYDDNGDMILPIPDELLDALGWKNGDTLSFDVTDGVVSVGKVEVEKVLVLVETVSTFRMAYLVEAPKDHPEYALDTVTMDTGLEEFGQKHLGEDIFGYRVVSAAEAVSVYHKENGKTTWTDEQILSILTNKESK